MPTPSPVIVPFMRPFASAFNRPTFEHVLTLIGGTLLASGRRTVTSALRAVGLIDERHFTTYHRVLNRAVWSPLQLSRILLGLLIDAFVATNQPLVIAVDDTLERRFGRRVAHKGIYHDAVRSKPGHPATTTGIRWLCCSAIVRLPWSSRPWALPFLTIPAPSPTVSAKLGTVHRTVPERAARLVRLLRRWLPDRAIVLVGDSSFGVVELALVCRQAKVTWIARMRLTAALYAPVLPQPKGKPGVKPKKGPRQPTPAQTLANPGTRWRTIEVAWYDGETRIFDAVSQTALWHRDSFDPVPLRWVLLRDPTGKLKPMVLGCTDEAASPEQIVNRYILRWNIEVTFQEARLHLGIETQRQWTRRAIERTTPCLFGLFSLVVLLAHRRHGSTMPTRQSAWYAKEEATFIDLLAVVRREIWRTQVLNRPTPGPTPDLANSPGYEDTTLAALLEIACYAA
jgi:DDE superfamily endonuclease